jgi:hypothetical protein
VKCLMNSKRDRQRFTAPPTAADGSIADMYCGLLSVLGAVAIAAVCGSCGGTYRPSATCQIAAGPRGLPHLYRMSEDNRFRAHTVPVDAADQADGPMCEGSAEADKCENSDDIEALIGGAVVKGPSGKGERQPVCPAISPTITCETASVSAPICASSTCPNLQLAIAGKDGVTVHVLMHDDPSCHPSMHRNPCATAPAPCYYRIHSLALDLTGPALKAP